MTPPSKPKRSPNRRIAVLVGIVVSVIFLFLAFRGLQPEAFLDNITQVNPLGLLLGAAVYAIAVTIISLRWQFLLRAVKLVPLFPLTQIVAIGYMGNNVYPLRAGEALRAFLLRRDYQIPFTSAVTTVAVERVFDGIVMLSFIFVGLQAVQIESPEVQTILQFATPLFVLAVIVFFTLAALPNLLKALVEQIAKLLPERLGTLILGFSEDIIGGLAGLRSPIYLFGAVIASYTTWAVEALVYWIVMGAFGLDLGYPVALLVVGVVNLAGLIPASPGQIGVYEFFVSTVLVAVGIAQDEALAYAIVVHIVIWLPVTLAGFGFLARRGLGWSDIGQARDLEAESTG